MNYKTHVGASVKTWLAKSDELVSLSKPAQPAKAGGSPKPTASSANLFHLSGLLFSHADRHRMAAIESLFETLVARPLRRFSAAQISRVKPPASDENGTCRRWCPNLVPGHRQHSCMKKPTRIPDPEWNRAFQQTTSTLRRESQGKPPFPEPFVEQKGEESGLKP
jgi:hypothetical protein